MMLVLVAHGSHRPEWRAAVERVVQEAQRKLGERRSVRLAYMDCTAPTVLDVVAEAMSEDLARVRVLPLFLADEGHVSRDVRPLVDQVRHAYPGLDVEMLPAMGQHPAFVKLICEIAETSD
jgi:sirohydrochlorin cobaltochelatase